MRGTNTVFDTRWVRIVAYSLFGIFLFIGIWQGLSTVFAQMPPPATTICAITNLCNTTTPPVTPPPPASAPSYTISKDIVDGNGDPSAQRVFRPGEEVRYKITVTKSQPIAKPACSPLTSTISAGTPITFTASGGDGDYVWSAQGADPSSGSGATFTTSYPESALAGQPSAQFSAIVDGSDTGICLVTVEASSLPPGVIYDNLTVIDSEGSLVITAGYRGLKASENIMMKSTDSGNNWAFNEIKDDSGTVLRGMYVSDIAIIGQTVYLVGNQHFSRHPLIYKSSNNGDTWQNITGQFEKYDSDEGLDVILSVDATDPNSIWMSGNNMSLDTTNPQKAVVYKSTDGGSSWTRYLVSYPNSFDLEKYGYPASPTQYVPNFSKLRMVDSQNGWAGDGFMNMFRTIDGGVSWFAAGNSFENKHGYVAGRDLVVINSKEAVGLSVNIGTYAGPVPILCAPDTYVCSYPWGVYKTTDGGSNWSYLMNGNGIVNDGGGSNMATALSVKGNTIWAVGSDNYEGEKLCGECQVNMVSYVSRNGGTSWTSTTQKVETRNSSLDDVTIIDDNITWGIGSISGDEILKPKAFIGKMIGNGSQNIDLGKLTQVPDTGIWISK